MRSENNARISTTNKSRNRTASQALGKDFNDAPFAWLFRVVAESAPEISREPRFFMRSIEWPPIQRKF